MDTRRPSGTPAGGERAYNRALSVVGLSVEPGARVTHVAEIAVGTLSVPVPVIAVNGRRPGPRVAVTGGIHGSEYVAIEAARRVGMTVDPDEMAGSLVVVPIANTTSYFKRTVYTSGLDMENLNRVFPGDPRGSPSQVLAAWLFETIMKPSQFYIDMHGGDMIEALVPFVLAPLSEDRSLAESSLAMAVATGIPRVIKSEVNGSTCAATTAAGIPSILAEVGGEGVWDEQLVAEHMDSTLRVLRHLGVLPGGEPPRREQRVYDTFAWIRATASGLFHPSVRAGDVVEQGQPLGAVVDYFGNVLQPVEAVTSGEVVFLVTSLAMNSGDPLLAIGA